MDAGLQTNSKLLDLLYILDWGHYRLLSEAKTTFQWNHVIPLVKAYEWSQGLRLNPI
jgi:hypothetical protein